MNKKFSHKLTAAILVVFVGSMISGCQLFHLQKDRPDLAVAEAQAVASTTINALVDARQAGQIPDDQWAVIKPLGLAVSNAVETADKAVQSGDSSGYAVAMKLYRQGIDELLAWKLRTQKKQ